MDTASNNKTVVGISIIYFAVVFILLISEIVRFFPFLHFSIFCKPVFLKNALGWENMSQKYEQESFFGCFTQEKCFLDNFRFFDFLLFFCCFYVIFLSFTFCSFRACKQAKRVILKNAFWWEIISQKYKQIKFFAC